MPWVGRYAFTRIQRRIRITKKRRDEALRTHFNGSVGVPSFEWCPVTADTMILQVYSSVDAGSGRPAGCCIREMFCK